MAILVLVTGGSFDKEYNELDGALSFRTTHLPDLLRLARSTVKLRLHTLFLMDSSCMTGGAPPQNLSVLQRSGGNADCDYTWYQHHGRNSFLPYEKANA